MPQARGRVPQMQPTEFVIDGEGLELHARKTATPDERKQAAQLFSHVVARLRTIRRTEHVVRADPWLTCDPNGSLRKRIGQMMLERRYHARDCERTQEPVTRWVVDQHGNLIGADCDPCGGWVRL